jgi:transcriptional regulator with XRE-family HTH domain
MTGKQLRTLRRSTKLTQAQFARLLGLAPNTVARLERDELRIREPIARLAEMTTERLLDLDRARAEYERATANRKPVVSHRLQRAGDVFDDVMPPRPRPKRS